MKPKIICHIMSSVDGRLLNDRWTEPFDGTPASDLLQVYAAIGRGLGTDAWMFGKNTLRAAFSYKWGIDGLSGVPSIFEYVGSATDCPAAGQSLQLLSAEQREHGVMWLRYKFHKKRHK